MQPGERLLQGGVSHLIVFDVQSVEDRLVQQAALLVVATFVERPRVLQ
jgi:hypothetical protein